jgi:adenosylcobalamin-dependent ribonucleoside-triphosphate reductase
MGRSPTHALSTPARNYHSGMGKAVADRTVNRKIIRKFDEPELIQFNIPAPGDISHETARAMVEAYAAKEGYVLTDPIEYGTYNGVEKETMSGFFWATGRKGVEDWADVAKRVAHGNSLLEPRPMMQASERQALEHHLRQASVLMSGRHLQHGDETQPTRNMEVFTNCLHGDTKILTLEHGPVAIDTIVGQTVTVKARDGVWRPAAVKSYGTQELFRIKFGGLSGPMSRTSQEVIATANHRWFLRDGTVTTTLKVGDVLENPVFLEDEDDEAIRHGLIFGDGSSHKRRNDYHDGMACQGRDYLGIRLCGADKKYLSLFDGFGVSYPKSAGGDPVVYVGKKRFWKEVPFTVDPSYVAGFIKGWWLADGSKTYDRPGIEISTSNEAAIDWLREYAAYAGYRIVGMTVHDRSERIHPGFDNGKTLYTIRLTRETFVKVRGIEDFEYDEVYCVEEPVTQGFVLANGLLTGNCATAANTFLLFYLLLNGAGVGRAYDDDMIVADLNQMPIVVCAIDWNHQDVEKRLIQGYSTVKDAKHLYADRKVTTYVVPDSREGWAKAIEIVERMAFEERRDEVLILDFSIVRPRDAPIMGMQGRPASGPGPLMAAIANIAKLRDAGMAPWRAAIYADHYAAECVLVGGARRAARMSTKNWRDKTIFDFIAVKRGGFLWSSNNSVTVDADFRNGVLKVRALMRRFFGEGATSTVHTDKWLAYIVADKYATEMEVHAFRVMKAIAAAAYNDGTGEPGIINQDRLTQNDEGLPEYLDGMFAEGAKFKVDAESLPLMQALAKACIGLKYKVITNPCGEIVLLLLGGYCVIADVVPFHAGTLARNSDFSPEVQEWAWDTDAEDAFRTATRALIRTNLMDCIYKREVTRTNRIGVGITGFHEWAYARFGFTWHDIVDEEKSKEMWLTLSRFKRAIVDESMTYAMTLGVTIPHTNTTFKPAGTTSKLFGLTEGAHLPTMREFVRWVQFRNDDPLVKEYESKGYPIKHLKTYSGTTIVGFPTRPAICELDGGAWVVTASEATPEEQYRFLELLEKYWLTGVEEDGVTPLAETGNQVSYTLKYDPKKISFDRFWDTLIEGQFKIRCCSVMPQEDKSAYEYLPESAVNKEEYEHIAAAIAASNMMEDIGLEHIDCASGACPVDIGEKVAA